MDSTGSSGTRSGPGRARAAGRLAVVSALALAVSVGGTHTAAALAPAEWEVVAHRGGNAWGPEHTLETFGHMIEVEADAVEFDVRFTQDHMPVVFHDNSVHRTTDCVGRITDLTWAALKQCDAGSWFDDAFAGQRVPKLVKTLRWINKRAPGMEFYIHVKSPSSREARKIMKAVHRANIAKRDLTLICGNVGCLDKLAKAGRPNERLGYVFKDASGWASDYPVLVPFNTEITPELVLAAQARGQKVMPVENRPLSRKKLAALPIDGILANDLDAALVLVGRAPVPVLEIPVLVEPPPAPEPAPAPGTDEPDAGEPDAEEPARVEPGA